MTPEERALLLSIAGRVAEIDCRLAAILAQMPRPDRVVTALGEAFPAGANFSSAEAIAAAERQRDEAPRLGQRALLAEALAEAELPDAAALGRYLGRCRGIERIGTNAAGAIWRVVAPAPFDAILDDSPMTPRR
jgi:hypothetical protein